MTVTAQPKVSVIIPAYNHASYVVRGIDSVLRQTHPNIELVVVDDGSTDDTWRVIEEHRERSGGAFSAYRKPNGGISSALNYGIERSSGDLVGVLASDDYFALDKIARQVQLFADSAPDVGLVHSSAYLDFGDGHSLVDLHGTYEPATGHCFMGLLRLEKRVVAPSVLFKRSAYEATGGFDESLVAEDVDFHVAVAAAGYAFAYDPRPLVYKTVVKGGLGSNTAKCFESHFKMLSKYADQLGDDQYSEIENTLYRGLGLTAATTGDVRLAAAAYWNWLKRDKGPRPLAEFAYYSTRHLAIRALPGSVRHALRQVRARLSRLVINPSRGKRSGATDSECQ